MPQISIIVPVYKVEPYIRRCVDSILAQTYSDFELILVDDGSPDNCGAICDEYAEKDGRIHVIHQANAGVSASRNTGIDWAFANSDSEWLSFIDSDDWVHPSYLESLHHAAVSFSASVSLCWRFMTKGETIEPPVEEEIFCVGPEEQYTKWYTAYAWGKLYKKRIFSTLRYPVGKLYEDVAIWYKILFSCDKIAIVNRPLYYYFQRSDSIVGSAWTPVNLDQVEAWEEQLAYICEHVKGSVLDHALRRNCGVLQHQYRMIQKSDRISDAERRKYGKYVKRKLNRILRQYEPELKRIGIYSDYYSFANPKLAKLRHFLRMFLSPKKAAAACKEWVLRLLTKPSILFESFPPYADNALPVYEEMVCRGMGRAYNLVWMDDNGFPVFLQPEGSVIPFSEIRPKLVRRLHYWSLTRRTAAIICCNRVHFPTDPEKARVFYLSHGTPMKSLQGYYDLPGCIDYVLAASEAVAPVCAKEFSVSPEKVFSLGFPRNDVFSEPAQDIRSMLGTTCSRVIVWYPTYRQNLHGKITGSTHPLPIIHDQEAAIRLNQAAKEADVLIVLKPHFAQDLSLIRDLGLENILFISDSFFAEHNITSYRFVNSCDALITDYSSIYFDYTLADKPIAVTWDDLEEYRSNPGFAVDLEVFLKGAVKVYSVDELISFIRDVASGRDVLKTERREIRDLVNYSVDGKNTERVVDYILERIKN